MLSTREYGTWWAQAPHLRRWAYYLNLRYNYEMSAQEALNYIRSIERAYPSFITHGPFHNVRTHGP